MSSNKLFMYAAHSGYLLAEQNHNEPWLVVHLSHEYTLLYISVETTTYQHTRLRH